MTSLPLTVVITTRNRPAAVERCVRSLGLIRELVDAAIILDDASDPPLDVTALSAVALSVGITLEVVRQEQHAGTAAGKNRIARLARAPYLLSLDDDAYLVKGDAVRGALDVL